MDWIFKIGLLSLEWKWGLLALNIIPIFFKNNVLKKTKIRSIKNIWTVGHCIQPKRHIQLLRIRNSREANIEVRSQALYLVKICSLQISSRNWSHVHGNLFKALGFYRFFLYINVISFCFHFLQGMLCHALCYLKLVLCNARKSWIFKIFSLMSTLDVMPWISRSSKIKSITESFWGSRW